MQDRQPSGGLIAPIPAATLRAMTAEGELLEGLVLVVGQREHHALLDLSPSADLLALEAIAERLSLQHSGDFYVFAESVDDEVDVTMFRDGRPERGIGVAPESIAEQLGCPFKTPTARAGRWYLVVEGARAADVSRVLRARHDVHVADLPSGAMAWTDREAFGIEGASLSRALSQRVYSVFDEPEQFAVNVFERGELVAQLEDPWTGYFDIPRAPDIRGAKTREEILRALEISGSNGAR